MLVNLDKKIIGRGIEKMYGLLLFFRYLSPINMAMEHTLTIQRSQGLNTGMLLQNDLINTSITNVNLNMNQEEDLKIKHYHFKETKRKINELFLSIVEKKRKGDAIISPDIKIKDNPNTSLQNKFSGCATRQDEKSSLDAHIQHCDFEPNLRSDQDFSNEILPLIPAPQENFYFTNTLEKVSPTIIQETSNTNFVDSILESSPSYNVATIPRLLNEFRNDVYIDNQTINGELSGVESSDDSIFQRTINSDSEAHNTKIDTNDSIISVVGLMDYNTCLTEDKEKKEFEFLLLQPSQELAKPSEYKDEVEFRLQYLPEACLKSDLDDLELHEIPSQLSNDINENSNFLFNQPDTYKLTSYTEAIDPKIIPFDYEKQKLNYLKNPQGQPEISTTQSKIHKLPCFSAIFNQTNRSFGDTEQQTAYIGFPSTSTQTDSKNEDKEINQ